jgi:hypothetical protein
MTHDYYKYVNKPLLKSCVKKAARSGSIDVLNWLHSKSNWSILPLAGRHGKENVRTVKWVTVQGHPVDGETIRAMLFKDVDWCCEHATREMIWTQAMNIAIGGRMNFLTRLTVPVPDDSTDVYKIVIRGVILIPDKYGNGTVILDKASQDQMIEWLHIKKI